MMSETTLLTTSTVIVGLLNGKMIAYKIEFKIRVITFYIKLNHSRPTSLQCVWLTSQQTDQMLTENCLSFVR